MGEGGVQGGSFPLSEKDLSLVSGASSGVGEVTTQVSGTRCGGSLGWSRNCPVGKDTRSRAAHTQSRSMLSSVREVSQPPLPGSQLLVGPKLGW